MSNLCQRQSKALPLEQIMDNPHYKAVHERSASLSAMIDAKQEQIQKHTDEISQLYSSRREWEDNVAVGFAIHSEDTNSVYSFIECCQSGYSGP